MNKNFMATNIHASCVELNGQGLILRGRAGAGKSSFALSLINRGFKLVCDDQIMIKLKDNCLVAEPAESIKGILEVRGIGILEMQYSSTCNIKYIIDLIPGFHAERLPFQKSVNILGLAIPSFQIDPLDPIALEKVMILFCPDFVGFYPDKNSQMHA